MRPATTSTRVRRWWSWPLLAACVLFASAAAQIADDPAELGVPPGLQAPTSPAFADAAWYDLVAIRWVEPSAGTVWLEVELGAVDPAGSGSLGLRQPIIEVYVDDGGGGAATLLPGSGLRMPDGDGWRHAVRITGDGVWWWEAVPDGRGLLPPRSLPAVLDGRVVRIAWPGEPPTDARVYAVSGVHDPFSADGWRPLASTPSPWAFASETGGPPVIDVLPGGIDAWASVREGGALLRDGATRGAGGGSARWHWWVLMAAGLGLASGGLWWRSRPPAPPAPAGTETGAPPASRGDDPLITDADVGDASPGDTPPPHAPGAPEDDAPSRAAGQPPATGSAAGVAGEAADVDEGSSTRATEAPSEESRSAKRS